MAVRVMGIVAALANLYVAATSFKYYVPAPVVEMNFPKNHRNIKISQFLGLRISKKCENRVPTCQFTHNRSRLKIAATALAQKNAAPAPSVRSPEL